jgi:hypothetical protein
MVVGVRRAEESRGAREQRAGSRAGESRFIVWAGLEGGVRSLRRQGRVGLLPEGYYRQTTCSEENTRK